jgi:mevalonate pyrophosphate decarboxylase
MKKPAKALPSVSKAEVDALPKTEAVLLRLTVKDKATIFAASSSLSMTATEFLTKSALLVANKVQKK